MNREEAKEIVESLKNGNLHYEDDYFGGESLTFGYDKEAGKFYIHRIDTIVGSYNRKDYYESAQDLVTLLEKL